MRPQPNARLYKNRLEAPCVTLPIHSSPCTPSNHGSEICICRSHACLPNFMYLPLVVSVGLFAVLAFYINGVFHCGAFCNVLFPNLVFKFVRAEMAGFFVS